MTYAGIDYGLGKANVDPETGIRYGVISQHSIMPEAMDDFEQDYGAPTCGYCGNPATAFADVTSDTDEWERSKYACDDYACISCERVFDSSEVYSDEPLGFSYEGDGYVLENCLDSDVFVFKSPYYTRAQFCSPCVPGAGNLDTPCEDGPMTYCLGLEWFEDETAPYPVFLVDEIGLCEEYGL